MNIYSYSKYSYKIHFLEIFNVLKCFSLDFDCFNKSNIIHR